MKLIKANYPNQDPIHIHIPTSAKEVKVLFLVYGINAWPMKLGGLWHILYGGSQSPVIFNTGQRCLDNCSFKDWLEIGQKNMPAHAKCDPYEDPGYTSFFKWPNVKKYVENEKR